MDAESIVLKLGLDGTQVGANLRQILSQLKGFGKDGEKSFVEVGSAARGFHQMIEQITASSPVLGSALKLALSPIVGIMAGATAAFAFAQKQLADFNAELDRMEELNTHPMSNMALSIRKAAEEYAKMRREIGQTAESKKWTDEQKQRADELADNLESAKTQSTLNEQKINSKSTTEQQDVKNLETKGMITHEEAAKQQFDIQMKYARQLKDEHIRLATQERDAIANSRERARGVAAKADKAVAKATAELGTPEGAYARREKLQQEQAAAQTRIDALKATEMKARLHAESMHDWGAVAGSSIIPTSLAGAAAKSAIVGGMGMLTNSADAKDVGITEQITKEQHDMARRATAIDKLNADANTALKQYIDRQTQANDEVGNYDKALKSANRELGKAKLAPVTGNQPNFQLDNSAYRSTVEQLANQGQWVGWRQGHRSGRFFQPTAIGAFAGRLERDKNWMANATAMGMFVGANGEYDAKKAEPYLKSIHSREAQLEKAGLIKKGPAELYELFSKVVSDTGVQVKLAVTK